MYFSAPDAHEPPLFARDDQANPLERHRLPISYRWLVGTILVAAFGSGILFMALKASDGGRFAAAKPSFASVRTRSGQRAEGRGRKGDSLASRDFVVDTLDRFRAPLTERHTKGELSKIHNIVHVTLPLLRTIGDERDIPDLDAILHKEIEQEAGVEITDATEADLSIVRREIPELSSGRDQDVLSDSEVVKQVFELIRLTQGTLALPEAFTDQRMLSRTLRMAAADSADSLSLGPKFGSLDVRIVPENLTVIAPNTDDSLRFAEVDVPLETGSSLAVILRAHGAAPSNATAIDQAFHLTGAQLMAGQRFRLTIGPTSRGREIQRVVLFDQRGPIAAVAENDLGQFGPVPTMSPVEKRDQFRNADSDDEEQSSSPEVFKASYARSVKAGIPRKIIEEALRELSETIDLRQPTAPGDNLELIFTNDEAPQSPELLFAHLTASSEKQDIYRFTSAEGRQYLGAAGVSLDKLLIRKPLANGRMSSPFGMRRHPLLGYARLHNGVDWAAPQGTPLLAAGDGVVKWAAPRSGYGNRLELEHEQGYASAYNHMSAYARGIKPGAHVHRGQVVGYVGTTGLSTGPHVHFEITSNGHFVDPMKVRLPSRRQLAGEDLASFQDQKSQLDHLRAHSDTFRGTASLH